MYDYLIVGAGLFGSVFANEALRRGKHCLVIDKRSHIGGNIYTKETEGIQVHVYGPHVFHTDKANIWEYVNRFTSFNRFTYSPMANYHGEYYNLPFNMNTFNRLWGVTTPEQAKARLQRQIDETGIIRPENLEQQALCLVGPDIYEKLIKGYTEKQWGRPCSLLPTFIIRRLPVRFIFDNNYFNDPYQGIPVGGYTKMIDKVLDGVKVQLNTDFFKHRGELERSATKIVFTGMIDEYYGYQYGHLEYRTLSFEHETMDIQNFQGVAAVNYTDAETPWTRIIEHKHFEFGQQKNTIITREYPGAWKPGDEPYYPVNDDKNNGLYAIYKTLADKETNVIFGGRLGMYRYLDMHQVIDEALSQSKMELS